MLISLSEIMTTRNKVESITAPIEIERFRFQGSSYEFVRKDPVNFTITNLGCKRVMLEGKTKISLNLNCSRCLKEIEFPMDIHFSKKIDFGLTEAQYAENLDEMNYMTGYNLDVDILVYEEILIGFPMQVLCSEDCKGLCKYCGANLNEESCNCDNTEHGSQMGKIQDIFNKYKEV
jgi:uncharacterized protein